MIYLYNLEQVDEFKLLPTNVHYIPFDAQYGLGKPIEELQKEGVLIDKTNSQIEQEKVEFANSNQVPDSTKNYKVELFLNVDTKTIMYDYVEVPQQELTSEEKITQLEAQVLDLQNTINSLLGV